MEKRYKGRLWVIAAPSGGGKTSLVEAAVEKIDGLVRSISYTTRKQRPGELDGKDYNFVSKEEFEKLLNKGAMLESELVFGNYYGTSLEFIENYLNKDIDVVLTIDWQGSRHIKNTVKCSKGIFILPPRISVLEERLRNRGQDDEEVIKERMKDAKEQASHYDEFDYLVINDNFELALEEVVTIIKADRLLRHRQADRQKNIIQELFS